MIAKSARFRAKQEDGVCWGKRPRNDEEDWQSQSVQRARSRVSAFESRGARKDLSNNEPKAFKGRRTEPGRSMPLDPTLERAFEDSVAADLLESHAFHRIVCALVIFENRV